jgi:hypothetical protein
VTDPDDLLVAYKMAQLWENRLNEHIGPWPCPGPIYVFNTTSSTGSISEVTPDPHTVIKAEISCPHVEPNWVMWSDYEELPKMVNELLDREVELVNQFQDRVVLLGAVMNVYDIM